MGDILIIVGLAGIGLLGLAWLWPKVRGLFPTSVTTPVDTLVNVADKAAAAAGLEVVVQVFAARGDLETVTSLAPIWAKIWAFKPPEASK